MSSRWKNWSIPNLQLPTTNHSQDSEVRLGIGNWKWLEVGSWELDVGEADPKVRLYVVFTSSRAPSGPPSTRSARPRRATRQSSVRHPEHPRARPSRS